MNNFMPIYFKTEKIFKYLEKKIENCIVNPNKSVILNLSKKKYADSQT